MKIQKVTIKNLASLAEAEIDFTKNPLKDSPLFLICGDTGAGKSTITDAICLALYGSTPRFKDAQQDDFESEDSIKTSDVRNFMRKGTAESQAKVEFLADDGCVYRADWVARRAHGKVDGKLQDIKRTLYCQNKNTKTFEPVTEKVKEFESRIEELTGYDFGRFARCVLLAQNQFSRFLFASQDEKSVILQMLTNTDVYEKISKKIYEKFSSAKNALEAMSQSIGRLKASAASDEEIKQQKDILHQLRAQSQACDAELEAASQKLEWRKRYAELQSALAAKQADLEKAKSCSKEIEPKKLLLSKMEIAVREFRPILNEIASRKTALDSIQDDFRNAGHKYCQYLSLYAGLKSKIQENTRNLSARQQELDSMLPNQNIYDNIQTISQLIKNLIEADKNLASQRESLKEVSAKILQLKGLHSAALEKFRNLDSEVQAAETGLKAAEKAFADFDSQALSKLRNETAESERIFGRAKEIFGQQIQKASEYQALSAQLEACKKSAADFSARNTAIGNNLKELETQHQAQKQLFEQQQLSISKNLKELRAQLAEGEACPLCGSTNHPYSRSGDVVLDSLFEATKQELASKELRIRQLSEQKAHLLGALAEKQNQIKNLETADIPKLAGEIEQLKSRCASAYDYYGKKYPQDFSRMDKDSFLLEIDKKISVQKSEILEKEKQYQLLSEAFQKARKNYDARNKSFAAAKDQKAGLESEIAVKNAEYQNVESNIKASSDSQSSLVAKLGSYIQDFENVPESLSLLLTKCEAEARAFAGLRNKIEEKKKYDEHYRGVLENCAGISSLDNIFPYSQPLPPSGHESLEQLPNLLAAILEKARMLGNQKAENESLLAGLGDRLDAKIAQENARDSSLDFNQDSAGIFSASDASSIENLRAEIDEAASRLSRCSQSAKDAEANFESHKACNPLGVKDDEDIAFLSGKCQEIKAASSEKKTLAGETTARIAQMEACKAEYQKLCEEREAKRQIYDDWFSLNSEFGSHDGKKLRNMAQVHTLRILLRNADEQLKRLTDKYSLRCGGDSLAILVEDMEMGVRRPVTTLSGGESFMVSLALALGLSDMMQGGRGSEMLFIDEGFGTLDQGSLNSVISVLEKLHSQGRKVGIISHVPELGERIEAKILVRKCVGDNTRSEVVAIGNC